MIFHLRRTQLFIASSSGLVEYCTIEQLADRKVIVLANLKPRAIKGITSYGMLLCASNADHTEVRQLSHPHLTVYHCYLSQVVPLDPPAGAKVGELVMFEGHASEPAEAGNRASKAYSKIADEFIVNDQGLATFQGVPFMTSDGPMTSTLKGKIS